MKPSLPALAASLVLLSFGCSDAQQPGSLGGGGGGSSSAGVSAGGSSAGSAVGGNAAGVAGSQAGSAGSAVVGGGGAGGAGGVGGGGGTAGGFVLSDDPGTRAYEIHCMMCHGVQGEGTPLAPETQHPVRDYSTWVVRTGLPGVGYLKPMEIIPPDMLSDADLMLIFDYLDKPPQPTTAEGLYLDYCGNCHGKDGKGGPSTRDVTGTITHDFEDIVRDGTHPGMYDERNEYMSAYSTMRISDAELALIKGYVDTL